jgi:hypothetical protein
MNGNKISLIASLLLILIILIVKGKTIANSIALGIKLPRQLGKSESRIKMIDNTRFNMPDPSDVVPGAGVARCLGVLPQLALVCEKKIICY